MVNLQSENITIEEIRHALHDPNTAKHNNSALSLLYYGFLYKQFFFADLSYRQVMGTTVESSSYQTVDDKVMLGEDLKRRDKAKELKSLLLPMLEKDMHPGFIHGVAQQPTLSDYVHRLGDYLEGAGFSEGLTAEKPTGLLKVLVTLSNHIAPLSGRYQKGLESAGSAIEKTGCARTVVFPEYKAIQRV
jgi:hypothetical protein